MFSSIKGNENVKDLLRRFLAAGRVPNSLLFAGPEGVGKRLFALELAKTLICKSRVQGEACDNCPLCTRAAQFEFPKPDDKDSHEKVIFSRHADIGTIVPYNRYLLVKAVRDLEREANFRPFEAPARIFIVDDADKMNEAASNALLKTLEEPPTTSYIFLITSRPDSLLPTILSRCQTIRFGPVSTPDIAEFLAESGKLATGDVEIAARLANGSIGRALSIDMDKFRKARSAMAGVLEAILLTADTAEMLRLAEAMNDAKNKDDYEENVNILKTLVHDVWLLSLGRDASIVNLDIRPQLGELAKAADPRRLAQWLSDIEELQGHFAVNINRKVGTDALFMKMAA